MEILQLKVNAKPTADGRAAMQTLQGMLARGYMFPGQHNLIPEKEFTTVHIHSPMTTQVVDEESGIPFSRTHCWICKKWLGDRPLTSVLTGDVK